MKIIIIGGSRGIGRQTVKTALERGHNVTVFARNPKVLDIHHPNLHLKAGDVLDSESVEKAIAGHEAVICTLGLPTRLAIGPPFAKPSYVLSTGTANILQAIAKLKINRFICVTAIGTGDSAKQCTPLARLVLRGGLRWLFKEKDRQERFIKASKKIDWTIIRPTALTNGQARGAMVGPNLGSGILTHVSRADVAATIINNLNLNGSFHKALVVSYPARVGDSFRWVIGYFGRS